MGNRHKSRFTKYINGHKGYFECITIQPYQDCEISAGLIQGTEPDTVYLRFDRDNEKPITIALRPDEAQAIIFVLSGALWSQTIKGIADKDA